MWTILGALAVVGLGLMAIKLPWPGLASLLVAAVLGAIIALNRHYAGKARLQWTGQLLGRGPYTVAQGVPNLEFANQLAAVARELRDAATSENWTVDWSRFNAQMDLATAAGHEGDYARAVRQYAQSISFLMAELKRQRHGGGAHESG